MIRKKCVVVVVIDLIRNLMAKYNRLCYCSTYVPLKMCKGSYSRESEFCVSADNIPFTADRLFLSSLVISLPSVYFPQVIKVCSVGTIKYSTAVSNIFNCQHFLPKILTYRIK